ncbi:hypothetical protein ACQR3P_29315 [Rhodococcus sp. IEGM1300]
MNETYMTDGDLKKVRVVIEAFYGIPNFNSYIVRGIAASLVGGSRSKMLASKRHLMRDEGLLNEAEDALRAVAEHWEKNDLFQELRLVMERIASKAEDGPTREYYIGKSFRYEVPRFFRLKEREERLIEERNPDICELWETACVDEWVEGECHEAFEELTSWERRSVLAIDSEGLMVSEAARRYGYSRQHLSRRYNQTKRSIHKWADLETKV